MSDVVVKIPSALHAPALIKGFRRAFAPGASRDSRRHRCALVAYCVTGIGISRSRNSRGSGPRCFTLPPYGAVGAWEETHGPVEWFG